MRFNRLKQSGMSLLEVNLALAIFAASLSVITNAYQQTGKTATLIHQRQQAYLLMAQMVAVLPSYKPNHLTYIANNNQTSPAINCFSGVLCNQQESLVSWYHVWTQSVQQRLPEGSLDIDCPQQCQPNTQLIVVIRWFSQSQSQSQPRVDVPDNTASVCKDTHCMRLAWLL